MSERLLITCRSLVRWLLAATTAIAGAVGQSSDEQSQVEFFESRIRPVLADTCYACHSTNGEQKGDVVLDHRAGMRSRTSEGTIVVPGKPEESVLMMVLRHEIEDLEMPEDGPRLRDEVIADFAQWIREGATDPRDAPPSKEDLAAATAWPAKLAHRRKWWSLQPVIAHTPPPDEGWSPHPVDRFVAAQQKTRGLARASQADRRTLLRRLSYTLTGLPPTTDELRAFEQSDEADAYERAVDQLLASPRFGEHWARHWMDVVRYADSHGSEGDPAIPYAYRYRDYLIRAFNQDIPYDQLIREHIAGDLLEEPRLDSSGDISESVLGAAHWRFVFHGYLPTEPLQEKVRFIDDQINVLGKAFLGQTVSCARCHDHKFDAISQADYFALFGVLSSCRPGIHDANAPARQREHVAALRGLKQDLRRQLAARWDSYAGRELLSKLAQGRPQVEADHPAKLLHEVDSLLDEGHSFPAALEILHSRAQAPEAAATTHWDPTSSSGWYAYGNGLTDGASRPGDFAVSLAGDQLLAAIYPRGAYTNLISTRHRGVLHSRRFDIGADQVAWGLVIGERAHLRCVVQDYPRSGLTFSRTNLNEGQWRWQRIDLTYWRGDRAHFELTTNRDAPVEAGDQDRSYFGLRELRVQPKSAPKPQLWRDPFGFAAAIQDAPPADRAAFAIRLKERVREAIQRWSRAAATDQDALLLHACLRHKLLPNTAAELADLFEVVERYRRLETKIPTPTQIPGLIEADASDHPLFARGDPNQPKETVPRRFLEVLGGRRYAGDQSGRRQLAEDVADADNPLTARVMVNRIWHHLFGRGIVATPDNFGQLGAKPTHPALLDHLAARFMENGWSIKDTIRYLVTSKTWRLAARAKDDDDAADPEGAWLTHARTRRLTAEALRDSLFATAGTLEDRMYGRPFGANASAPRRSVYVRARRNDLDAFLAAFDAPTPFAPVGARLNTNVPAQSLAMLNAPLVWELARRWARATDNIRDDEERLAHMLESATGRLPTKREVSALRGYMDATQSAVADQENARQQAATELAAARDRRAAILDPIRAKLIAELDQQPSGHGPAPLAAWDFRQGTIDLIGQCDGELRGSAKLDAGGLLLDGRGWFASAPLPHALTTKTLEAWVQLDGLDQTGGGVMTIQDLDGGVFDAIVYGERKPRQWIAGSDNFRRTQDVDGPVEEQAAATPIHLAITYGAGGEITAYRQGQPYGDAYDTSVADFRRDQAQVLVGLRHGHEPGGRSLRGRVLEARLYDRALTAAEVYASASGTPFVSQQQLLDALTDTARAQATQLGRDIAAAEVRLREADDASIDQDPWTLAAHAIFNLKEFLYLR